MPAFTNEPWRGIARVTLERGTGPRNFWVGVQGNTSAGDQTGWEGSPGSPVTLVFNTNSSGIGPPGTADSIIVEVRTPGGAQVGTTVWNPTASGQTRTFHFDSDPLDQAAGAARGGAFEVYLRVVRTSLGTYDVDSRGTGAVGSDEWARGYLRAPLTLSSATISNVAIDGAEPATWAFDDPIHTKAVLNATPLRSGELQVALRDDGGADVQAAATTTSTVNQTKSWTASGEKVDNSFDVGADDLVWRWPARDFGGDQEYVWAASGNTVGFTREDERHLASVARLSVDPQVTVTHHLQLNDNVYGAEKHIARRFTSELGFVTFRLTNARDEPRAGLTASETLADNAGLVSPAISRSVTTQADGKPASMATWDSALPSGTWTHTVSITSPAHATGLSVGPTAAWSLVAPNNDLLALVGGGNGDDPAALHTPGATYLTGVAIMNTATRRPVTADAGSVELMIGRINLALARKEYLDPTTLTWQSWAGANVGVPFTADTTPALVPSPGDSTMYLLTIPGNVTESWADYDIFPIARATVEGASVGNYIQVPSISLLFDPTGLFA